MFAQHSRAAQLQTGRKDSGQPVAADDKTDHYPARVANDRGPQLRLIQRPGWPAWPAALRLFQESIQALQARDDCGRDE